MVLELRGKLAGGDGLPAAAAAAEGGSEDVVGALLALGYSEREARAAAKDLPAGTETGEGVRLALRKLLKSQ